MVHKRKRVSSTTTRAIMRALYVGRHKWQTTREIAFMAGVSWITARSKLNKLYKRGHVSMERHEGRTYWKI